MFKVLLIQASHYSSKNKMPCKQNRIYLPGLALPLLAAITPSNWEVEILIEVVDEIDYETNADIVGIGAMGMAVFRANDIADEFRKKGKKVFMGGYMPSLCPWLTESHCDSIIIGDAEISYPMLLNDFATTGILKERYDNPLIDLNDLPVPKYELLLKKKIGYMLPVQAGRGCSHQCSYCSIACLYKGKYMARPVADVIKDIKRVKELGFKFFYLIDDNIISNPSFLEELCRQIKPLKMRWGSQCSSLIADNPPLLKLAAGAGCVILSMGIESISQEGLDRLNKSWVRVSKHDEILKQINELGIIPATEMIIGTDGDTIASIKATYQFVMRNRLPVPKFYILTPLPGSAMHQTLKQSGRILHEDFSRYNTAECVHYPEKISPQDLTTTFWWLYKKVYSIPNIFRRTIFHPGILKNPLMYLFAFAANIIYRKFIKNGDAPNIL